MDFDYTPEQEQLRREYRERLEAVMTPERRTAVSGRTEGSAIVLGENEGWTLITNQLNLERAALGNPGALEPLFEKTLEWAETTAPDEGFVIDRPWVRQSLARVEAQVAAYGDGRRRRQALA